MLGRRLYAAALGVLLASFDASADGEAGERRLTLGGFGTLGAVYHDEAGLSYRRSLQQQHGADAGELDLNVDSVAGLQLNAAWDADLEAVVQTVIRMDQHGNWRPRLARGFVRYQPSQEVMIRAGRLGYELIPGNTSKDVGYAALTIRPAVEVFGALTRDDYDGGDITLKQAFGDTVASLHVHGGVTSFSNVVGNGQTQEIDARQWGASVEGQRHGLTLRLSTGVMMLVDAPPVDDLVAALRQAGTPEAQALADELAIKGRRTLYRVVSATYENGPLQFQFMAARVTPESTPTPELDLGHASIGYRIGAFTPFVAAASSNSLATILPTGLPDTAEYAQLNAAAYATQTSAQYEQSTLSLGLRWDFAPKLALKFQVDRVHAHQPNLLLQDAAQADGQVQMTVFGAALDFVF